MNIINRKNTFFYLFTCLWVSTTSIAQTVLLTGGAGFIGSHVAQTLLRRGDTVVVVDNMNNAYDQRLKRYNISQVMATGKDKVYFYQADIRDYQAMDTIFNQHKPDYICHLAARAGVRVSLEIPEEYITSNIVGTLTIFELAQKYGIKHVTYASSSSVYGNCDNGPFVEDFDVSRPASVYAMTKCACELLAYTYYNIYGIGSTGLRFFTVYGPRGRVDMAPFIFMDAIHKGDMVKMFGDGTSQRDYTYVDDIVDGIIKAMEVPSGYQVLNLGRGEPIMLKNFTAIMERVVGKKANVSYEPMQITDVVLTHAQIDKAATLVGYAPRVSVEEGLQKMYSWYINEYIPTINGNE